MKPHSTVNIPIKYADIDIGIIPIIRFLNEMDGVITLFCCEGEYDLGPSEINRPYIKLISTFSDVSEKIINLFQPYIIEPLDEEYTFEWEDCSGQIHKNKKIFTMRFKTKELMDKFKKDLSLFEYVI